MDTYRSNLVQGTMVEKFLSEEDLSDYKQYKKSRRRQLIVKVIIISVVVIFLVTTIVYFTRMRTKEEGKLRACNDGEAKFQNLPGKCFSVRVNVNDESVDFVDHVEACMRHCLTWSWCYSIDFFSNDGECYSFSVLSSEVPNGDFVDTRSARHGVEKAEEHRIKWCSHYDRVCL